MAALRVVPAVLCLAMAPRAQDLDASIASLTDDERRSAACRVLEAAGERAVEPLGTFLQRFDRDVDKSAETQAALYVLGRLGARAAAALPAIRHAYGFGLDAGVRQQAMWAMTQVAAGLGDAATASACIDLLERQATAELDPFLFQISRHRLDIAVAGSVRADDLDDAAGAVAAAEALASGVVTADQDAWFLVLQLHERTTERDGEPWEAAERPRHDWRTSGPLALALLRRGMRDDARTARGLLAHWDPEVRREGLSILARTTEVLPPLEKFDVVRCLWDADRSVRDLAAALIGSYGADGLVGLAALRAIEREGRAPSFALICSKTADRIVEAARTDERRSPAARAVAVQLDAVLRGAQAPPRPLEADIDAVDAARQIVLGCAGLDAATCFAIGTRLRECGLVRRPVVTAFLLGMHTRSRDQFRAAAAGVAALGPRAATECPDWTTFAARLRSDFRVSGAFLFPAQAEMLAGAGATTEDLESALRTRHWHVAVRACCELAIRGEVNESHVEGIRAARSKSWGHAAMHPGVAWGEARGGYRFSRLEFDEPTLALAADLALHRVGEATWSTAAIEGARALELVEPDATDDAVRAALDEAGPAALARCLFAMFATRLGWPDVESR